MIAALLLAIAQADLSGTVFLDRNGNGVPDSPVSNVSSADVPKNTTGFLALASNLNVSAGQVIPNMVLARVGSDGAVMMFNNGGAIDLVADVVGYFTD